AENAVDARIAIGLDPAGDFVIAFILEGLVGDERAQLRIERGGGIAPFGENALGLVTRVAVVDVEVEEPSGIERVAIGMEPIAGVLDEDDAVLIPERSVVEAGDFRIRAVIDERQLAGVSPELLQLEDGGESTVGGSRF